MYTLRQILKSPMQQYSDELSKLLLLNVVQLDKLAVKCGFVVYISETLNCKNMT